MGHKALFPRGAVPVYPEDALLNENHHHNPTHHHRNEVSAKSHFFQPETYSCLLSKVVAQAREHRHVRGSALLHFGHPPVRSSDLKEPLVGALVTLPPRPNTVSAMREERPRPRRNLATSETDDVSSFPPEVHYDLVSNLSSEEDSDMDEEADEVDLHRTNDKNTARVDNSTTLGATRSKFFSEGSITAGKLINVKLERHRRAKGIKLFNAKRDLKMSSLSRKQADEELFHNYMLAGFSASEMDEGRPSVRPTTR